RGQGGVGTRAEPGDREGEGGAGVSHGSSSAGHRRRARQGDRRAPARNRRSRVERGVEGDQPTGRRAARSPDRARLSGRGGAVAVSAVAENYAEALFELGNQAGELERFGELLQATAGAVAGSPAVQAVLMNPKITKAAKADFLGRSVTAVGAPRELVLYLA